MGMLSKKYYLVILIAVLILSVSSSALNHKESERKTSSSIDSGRALKVDKSVNEALNSSDAVRVIVLTKGKYKRTAVSSVSSILSADKGRREFSSFNGYSAKLSKDEIETLKNDSDVAQIVLDRERAVNLDRSALLINSTKAWALIYNSTNITGKYETACVIDTGINYSHPDLGGCTAANFTGGNCSKVLSGYDFVNGDNNPMDDHFHGTYVAGIIASTNTTYRGVAPDATIVALKACNASGVCFDSDVISSIDWCVYNASRFNISVISMSLGGGSYTSWCDGSETALAAAVDSAVVKNISVVVSTGNSGSTTSIGAPACIRNATSVSSTDKSDAISSFSDRNNVTDLFAPGGSIRSLYYLGGTISASGTSASAPHVSSAFLLIKHYKKVVENNSTILPSEIQDALNSSGAAINDSSGSGLVFSRIDVFSAIKFFDSRQPNITLTLNMPSNSTNTSSIFIFANMTADEILSAALLELDNGTKANYSMSRSGNPLSWSLNQSACSGNYTYKVYGNDSKNIGVSESRVIRINNTPPEITSFSPSAVNLSISEPSNKSFNITVAGLETAPSIVWYVNGSAAKISGNFTFTGNYSVSGSYNITVIVSYGCLKASQEWLLEINNTNMIPILNFSNQTLAEDSSITFAVSATDADNESLLFSINDSRLTINATNGTINYTPERNFNGVVYINLTVTDNIDNVSQIMFINITPVNDAPLLTQIQNLSLNETDWANFTLNAGDVDNDTLNFAVNDTRFSQNGANFSLKTALNDSGEFHVRANVSDLNLSDSKTFIITIIDRFDSDGDSVPDIYDSDDDNDGIPDDIDNLIGNISSVSSGTINAINVTIDNSTSLLSFNGTRTVELRDANITLISFPFNFSSSTLNLANVTYEKQKGNNASGFLVTRGIFLQGNITKTIFIDNINTSIDTVCIKDAEIDSISNISSSCNSTNETLVACNSSQQGSYNCSLDNAISKYQITGLRFSGAIEQCADNDNDTYYVSGCGSGNDCNDNNKGINPDAAEICGNGIDENCDSIDTACPSSPSYGGGGSGGGGGGGSVKSNTAKASQFYKIITASEKSVMKARNPAISPYQLVFAPEQQVSGLTLSIELVNVSKLSSKVDNAYQYFNITFSQETGLENAEIYFAVNKSWFKENNFDEDKVKLMRHNYIWEEYASSKINETALQYSYYSKVPGFSVFAIASAVKEAEIVPIFPVGNLTLNTTNVTASQQEAGKEDIAENTPKKEVFEENKTLIQEEQRESSKEAKYRIFAALALIVVILSFIAWKKRRKGFNYYYKRFKKENYRKI